MTKSELLKDFENLWDSVDFGTGHELNLSIFSNAVNKYAEMNDQFVNIYSMKQKKVVAMSQNYKEIMGYDLTPEEYAKHGALNYIRDLPFVQSSVYLQLSYLYVSKIKGFLRNTPDIKNIFMYFHNFQVKHANQTKHLGVCATALNIKQTQDIDLILIINRDVSPLIKDQNLWWFNLSVEDKLHYSSHQNRVLIKPKHIFSNKEKDVLKLLIDGKTNAEISDILDISPTTLEKHRNNILEWSGAKDVAKLLQIVQFGNLLN